MTSPEALRGAKRILLFGGAFSPMHEAHLELAQSAYPLSGADLLLFLPSGLSPFKGEIGLNQERLNLIEASRRTLPFPTALSLEEFSPGATGYTIDTLTLLKTKTQAEFTFLCGLDTFLSLPRWKSFETLLGSMDWMVAERPAHDNEHALESLCRKIEASGRNVSRLPMQHPQSSTAIRALLEKNTPPELLIPFSPKGAQVEFLAWAEAYQSRISDLSFATRKAHNSPLQKSSSMSTPQGPQAEPLFDLITQALDRVKAEDVRKIDVSGRTPLFDWMVIASVPSARQAQAAAADLHASAKALGLSVKPEGLEESEWVLIDLGSVLVHLMSPEARLYYDLESLWEKKDSPSKGA